MNVISCIYHHNGKRMEANTTVKVLCGGKDVTRRGVELPMPKIANRWPSVIKLL